MKKRITQYLCGILLVQLMIRTIQDFGGRKEERLKERMQEERRNEIEKKEGNIKKDRNTRRNKRRKENKFWKREEKYNFKIDHDHFHLIDIGFIVQTSFHSTKPLPLRAALNNPMKQQTLIIQSPSSSQTSRVTCRLYDTQQATHLWRSLSLLHHHSKPSKKIKPEFSLGT